MHRQTILVPDVVIAFEAMGVEVAKVLENCSTGNQIYAKTAKPD